VSGRGTSHLKGLLAVAVAAALLAVVPATALAEKPSFAAADGYSIKPRFAWSARDYAATCTDDSLALKIDGKRGWLTKLPGAKPARGDVDFDTAVSEGEDVDITFKRKRDGYTRRFHARCIPSDFPPYSFHRVAAGGPKLFSMQLGYGFAAIFDRNGVPVWWYVADGEPDNVQILADGTVAYAPVDIADYQTGDYEIRTLKGRLLRVIKGTDGTIADIHDILLLPNGNYLIGAQAEYEDDLSAYGGPVDAKVVGIELQEITPKGELVSTWRSRDHIGLEETGRWWDNEILDTEPYDTSHWNSVELVGKHRMLLSFRHLDAIYMVDRRSGDILWKLGGTATPESLDVIGDPEGDATFGGQHDARLDADGTISIHDNRTGLSGLPRAVRYRVKASAGTARYVDAITDPRVTFSFCCGSSRHLPSGSWLVGWGGDGRVGGYDDDGNLLFTLRLDLGFSYRALPVPKGAVSTGDLRAAMDAMAGG